jgi:hypothetical protein
MGFQGHGSKAFGLAWRLRISYRASIIGVDNLFADH